MGKYGRRSRLAAVSICATVAGLVACAGTAEAFALKHTTGGLPLRWPSEQVTFVVQESVDFEVPGGVTAATSSAKAWGTSDAPTITVKTGITPILPAVDGQNSIIFAPHGFLPAGNALAVTLVSFDAATGEIVDADIVINGIHAFSVLASNATAPAGAMPVSNEGSSMFAYGSTGAGYAFLPFDFQHVVAHEMGHALGLADSTDEDSALMYGYTKPNDASLRAPAQDDMDGISNDYSASDATTSSSGGCKASVAGAGVSSADSEAGLALVVAAGAWLASRRRARVLIPCGAALLALMARPEPARSAEQAASTSLDATAHVVGLTTESAGGVFETTVELVPSSCHDALACPPHAYAHVWGGPLNGVRQQVGDSIVPQVGDEVDLAWTGRPSGSERQEAAMLAVRSPLRPR